MQTSQIGGQIYEQRQQIPVIPDDLDQRDLPVLVPVRADVVAREDVATRSRDESLVSQPSQSGTEESSVPQPAPPAIPPPTTLSPVARRRGRPASTKREKAPYVEAVKVSKGTWAFRLRWKYASNDRPIVYVDRVSDEVYEMITKEFHNEYKQALIQNYKGTIPERQSDTRNTSSTD
jgi:hypothetical protein